MVSKLKIQDDCKHVGGSSDVKHYVVFYRSKTPFDLTQEVESRDPTKLNIPRKRTSYGKTEWTYGFQFFDVDLTKFDKVCADRPCSNVMDFFADPIVEQSVNFSGTYYLSGRRISARPVFGKDIIDRYIAIGDLFKLIREIEGDIALPLEGNAVRKHIEKLMNNPKVKRNRTLRCLVEEASSSSNGVVFRLAEEHSYVELVNDFSTGRDIRDFVHERKRFVLLNPNTDETDTPYALKTLNRKDHVQNSVTGSYEPLCVVFKGIKLGRPLDWTRG